MEEKKKKYFDLALWLGQVLLATSLILAVQTKMGTPVPVLYEMWPWTRDHLLLFGSALIDLVAAIAIVMPAALDRNNKWTIYAAYGILVIMVTATAFHMYHGLSDQLAEDIVCIAIAIFVIWGRTKLPTIKHKETIRMEKDEAERAAREEAKKLKREEAKKQKLEKAKKLKGLQGRKRKDET